MPSPLPRHSLWRYCLAHPSSDVSLPRKGRRVGLCIVLFEACSAFTHVTACTLARHLFVARLPEGFRHFVTSMPLRLLPAGATLPGGIRTHWKAPPFHGAHPSATSAGLGSPPQSRRSASGRSCRLCWTTPRRDYDLPRRQQWPSMVRNPAMPTSRCARDDLAWRRFAVEHEIVPKMNLKKWTVHAPFDSCMNGGLVRSLTALQSPTRDHRAGQS